MEKAVAALEFYHMEIMEILKRAGEVLVPTKNAGQTFSEKRNARSSALPVISIIIPAHNEEKYLRQTLDALNQRNYPAYEIIVVANGCTDATEEAARGCCDRLVVLSQKSLGIARNLGARMAKGEILLFLDADTLLEPGALRIIAESFTRRYAAGTIKGKPDSSRFAYRLIYFMKNFTHYSGLHDGSAGVILCWKKHFMKLGGFDEKMEMRENSELIRRLKRFGGYRYIRQTAATTSMRRYEQRGVWNIVWLWLKMWAQSPFKDLRNRKYETVR
jgi:glycosyltransferase involved in cell wall biosynthesis